MSRTSKVASIALIAAAACGGGANAPKSAAEIEATRAPAPVATNPAPTRDGDRTSPNELLDHVLHADLVTSDAPIKLDGLLKEWPARVPARSISGDTSGAGIAVAVQYDDARIYFAADVGDTKFVRTPRFGEMEDHASLTIAFPLDDGHFSATEIAFYAGKPGESAGSVRFASGARKGQEVPGAKIVEAAVADGYTIEASIPWTTFAEARLVRVGLRAVARYYDFDALGAPRSVASTGPGDAAHPSELDDFPTEAERSLIEGLLLPKGIKYGAPTFALVADVAGDAMKERVLVYDRYFTICGPHYRGGKEFFYRELGAQVKRIEARDVTGRGKSDLLLWRRSTSGSIARDRFDVWSLIDSDEPTTTFAHEIGISEEPKGIFDDVHIGHKQIDVAYEQPHVWDASTFHESLTSDIEPLIVPWGNVKSQIFRFDGKTFVKTKEVSQNSAQNAATSTPSLPRDLLTPNAQTTTPAPDLSQRLFDQYKIDHNVAASVQPRIDLRVQLAGDARPERLVVVDRDIVVFGPGYLDGKSYAFTTLTQFDGARDIKDVTTRDVTGDGNADVVVRGVRHVPATDGGVVDMETMFIYEVRANGIARIFAVETARERGENRVQGLVQFVPARSGHGFDIDVRSGVAKGWTDKTYPWSQDAPGSGALEPLLLPWSKIGPLRYAWNGHEFARR